MCGASDQCRLAPLVRAGVWEHFRTWISYEAAYHSRALAITGGNQNDIGQFVREIRNQFSLGRRGALRNANCDVYGAALAKAINDLPIAAGQLVQFTRLIECFAEQQSEHTTNGVQRSMATKITWFFRPKGFTMYDSHARISLNVKGYVAFYETLEELQFQALCESMRGAIRNCLVPTLWPERIIDKMLWIMGDKFPCKHLITEPAALEPIVGQALSDQINTLTEALCPIICGSKLGKHLLDKPCFRILEAP